MSVCVFRDCVAVEGPRAARRIETDMNGEGGDGHIRSPEKIVSQTLVCLWFQSLAKRRGKRSTTQAGHGV
jgi:hypothetical protein